MAGPLVLGLNQYTHSAACCLAESAGKVLFALSKERLTRKKFDGGDTGELVERALESCGVGLEDLGLVVCNNHLFRIAPFEETLPWAAALHQYRPSHLHETNLLPGLPRHELSHHLAHAWSVLPAAPFDEGLILVMDGIGSTLRDVATEAEHYTTDRALPNSSGYRQLPADPAAEWGWREAESVYEFRGLALRRRYKRWTRENTPAFLYNYGFENMESLGAVYSRVSSHIFGDWNACGKVMGLAPMAASWSSDEASEWLLRGELDELEINWPRLRSEPFPNEWEKESHRPRYARLAADLQRDLEEVVLRFLVRLREESGQRRLCLAGGVALNSTLNGRIARECGFEEVFVPSYPGDEGVAVGCAWFGVHQLGGLPRARAPERAAGDVPRRVPLSPFLGCSYSQEQVEEALKAMEPWVESEHCDDAASVAADALAAGRIVGWFQGRSEFGPRALGNRSILAHPGERATVDRINSAIKKREAFRPFAPAVLAERAAEYFEGVTPSPFMSLTVAVRPERRGHIEAVVHEDGTARIQTLEREANPRFHALVSAFEARTGLPMVLNTSFNTQGEPIVETPQDALRTFLESDLHLLLLEDRVVRRRGFPEEEEWGRLRPRHEEGVVGEMVSDVEGEPLSVRLMAGGRILDSDALQLGLLEACTGASTLRELVREYREEFELEESAVVERLESLFQQRLIRFQPAADVGE